MQTIYFYSNNLKCIYYTEVIIPEVWCDARSIDLFRKRYAFFGILTVKYNKEDIPKKHIKKPFIKFEL